MSERVRGENRGGRVAVIDTETGEVIASVNCGGRAGEYTPQQLQERDEAIKKITPTPPEGRARE